MKLLSMTDFVLQVVQIPNVNEAISWEQTENRLNKIYQYSLFLKQPLKLEMFVPCDDEGNFLNEPNKKDYVFEHHPELVGNPKEYNEDKYRDDCLEWIMAKEKVLFEGFVFTENQKYSVINKIDLSVSPYGINNERLQITKLTEGKFHTWFQLFTIEDLIQCNLKLTQNALKQFM